MRHGPVEPVVFASICTVIGCSTAALLVLGFMPDALLGVLPAVAVGSFASCWILWSRAHDWIRFSGRLGGAIIGFCAALLAQYVSWYLWTTGLWIAHAAGLATEYGANPIAALEVAFTGTVFTLMLAGIFTVPAGITTGLLCAHVTKRRM